MSIMTELQLSQFPQRNYIRMAIKRSKGWVKRLHLGTAVIESDQFTILAKPLEEIGKFKFSLSKTGGLLFTEDTQGELEMLITPNITVFAYSSVPEGAYLEIINQGHTVVYYIPIVRKENKQ